MDPTLEATVNNIKYNPCTCKITRMQLDLNLLPVLNALLEEESVGGAAERLHLSEPAVSRSLGRIRKATGDPILIRTGRTMTPTPRALALRDEVHSLVLRSRAVLTPETELDLDTLERTFTLRCHDALTAVLAPTLVRDLRATAPQVTLRFLAESSVDTSDLGRGTVDLEIGSTSPSSVEIAHQHVADDDLVGITRTSNPLLAGPVDVTAFASADHVVVSRRGRLRDRVDDALDAAGHLRRVIAAVASTAAAIEIVRDTDAVVVLPRSISSRITAAADLTEFALPLDLPRVPIVLTWHRRLTTDPAHAWLRARVTEVVRQADGAGGGRH